METVSGYRHYIGAIKCLTCGGKCYPWFDMATPEGTLYEKDCPHCGKQMRVLFERDQLFRDRGEATTFLRHQAIEGSSDCRGRVGGAMSKSAGEYHPITAENLANILNKEGCVLLVNWDSGGMTESAFGGEFCHVSTYEARLVTRIFWDHSQPGEGTSPSSESQNQSNSPP